MAGNARTGRTHMLTVASATLFVALQALATALAAGWAVAGLFGLGDIGEYVLMALFSLVAFYGTYRYGRMAAIAEAKLAN